MFSWGLAYTTYSIYDTRLARLAMLRSWELQLPTWVE
jgi:hypothetical protein